MLSVQNLFSQLERNGISFFTGVPDSLLKDFCAYVTDHAEGSRHVITANEGGAVALATGHHLATGEYALVYMQNSGLGNAVNPLTSLADPEVYGIPMLLMIGWRGEPGRPDEPQHRKQGRVTIEQLETLEIPFSVLTPDSEDAEDVVSQACEVMRERGSPYALVVRAGTFEPYRLQTEREVLAPLTREEALLLVLDHLTDDDLIVSTTGMASRELFEAREARGEGHSSDFLTVGSMGHASQIALGVALRKPSAQVLCIDGDGAVIMHMGALGIIGAAAPRNLTHIVINNGAHDSVGGQPTVGLHIDLVRIAEACGYRNAARAETRDQIGAALTTMRKTEGPSLLEVRVRPGARPDLGRPTLSPKTIRDAYMRRLSALG